MGGIRARFWSLLVLAQLPKTQKTGPFLGPHFGAGKPLLSSAPFERHRFLTGFWVPKMVPKILQANLIFYVVFATLASQTVLAEKLKVFKKACRDASSPVLTKPPGEWEECYF